MWLALAMWGCKATPGTAADDAGTLPRDTSPPIVDTSATGETADTATAPAVPGIREALADLCSDTVPAEEPGAGSLHRVTLVGHDLVCNDGTAPVAYVRAATDPAHSDDWLFFLQGGSFCTDWDTCTERWCSQRGLMTGGGPLAMVGNGLLSPDPGNPVGGFNQVFMPYCTSDAWGGTQRDVIVEGSPSYRLDFTGRTIVEGTLDLFEQNQVSSDDGVEALPSLADADLVLWGGVSAGGWGAMSSLDHVAEQLDAEVRGVLDSIQSPQTAFLEPTVAAGADQQRQDQFAVFSALYAVTVDASCEAATDAAEQWRCADPAKVQADHLATPFLVAADLFDTQVGQGVLDAGASVQELGDANAASLRALVAARPDIGVWATRCGRHTLLRNDAYYNSVGVIDAIDGGAPVFARDALGDWAEGTAPVVVSAADLDGAGCPPF